MGVLFESFIAAWKCTLYSLCLVLPLPNNSGTLLATSACDRLLDRIQAVCIAIRKHISTHVLPYRRTKFDLAMHGIDHSAHASHGTARVQAHALPVPRSLTPVGRQPELRSYEATAMSSHHSMPGDPLSSTAHGSRWMYSIRDTRANTKLHYVLHIRLSHRIGGLVVKLAVAIRDQRSQCRPAPGSIPGRCILLLFRCPHGLSC
jgi:hypothetical protein